jgi:hypothetical protein
MDGTITKATEAPAKYDARLMRVFVNVGGTACAVWVLSHALAVVIYMFERHAQAHPGLDVLVIHGAELVASLLLIPYYGLGARLGFSFLASQSDGSPTLPSLCF